jgi:hypothetical protein
MQEVQIQRFPTKYSSGLKGDKPNKWDIVEIYEHFMDRETCRHIAQQINLYPEGKINKTLFSNIKSWDSDYMETKNN